MKPIRRTLFMFMLLVWTVVATAPLCAQTPLGPELVVAASDLDATFQSPTAAACDERSVCAAVWYSERPDGDLKHERVWAATYSPGGELLQRKVVSTADTDIGTAAGSIVAVGLETGFALFWNRVDRNGTFVPVFRRFDENLNPQGGAVELPFHGPSPYPHDVTSYNGLYGAVRTSTGYVFLSSALVTPIVIGKTGVFLYFVDFEGHKVRERVAVSEESRTFDARLPQQGGGLSQDGAGNLIVTYSASSQQGPANIYVRRFSAAGEPLGPEVRVNTYQKENPSNPQVAASPDGQFLVVWQIPSEDGSDDGIYGRLYSRRGRPVTPELRVNDVTLSAQRFPQVVADRSGNYFVGWDSLHPSSLLIGYEVKGKLYRHDLTPIGGELHLNQSRLGNQMLTQAAFAPDGALFALWSSESPRQTHGERIVPVIRRFAVNPP